MSSTQSLSTLRLKHVRHKLNRTYTTIRKTILPTTTPTALTLLLYTTPFLLVTIFALVAILHRPTFLVPSYYHRDRDAANTDSHHLLDATLSLPHSASHNAVQSAYARKVHAARAKWPSTPLMPEMDDEFWSKVKHDVVIGVKTGHEVATKRLLKLRQTGWWSVGRHVPNILIISDRDDEPLGVVGIKSYGMSLLRASGDGNANSSSNLTGGAKGSAATWSSSSMIPKHWFERAGWRGDKDKNLPAFHLLRHTFPDKKWYLLLDDDTYMFLENFARYIYQDGMNDHPIYTGKVFYISRCGGFGRDGNWLADSKKPRGLFAHGGSGIILNAKAMDAIYTSIPTCMRNFTSCWAGDMQVGLCLHQAGVVPRRLGRHGGFERHYIPFWPSKALSDKRYSSRWKSDEEPITFHKIPEAEQKLLSGFEKMMLKSGETVVYDQLRTHLLSNGIVPAHSARDKKNRYYSTEFSPKHL